jgi:hypothetical protein
LGSGGKVPKEPPKGPFSATFSQVSVNGGYAETRGSRGGWHSHSGLTLWQVQAEKGALANGEVAVQLLLGLRDFVGQEL